MHILIKLLEKLVSAITIVSIGGIFAVVILQVFCRFVLAAPLPWPVEISKILFGYLVFIGCAEASLQRTHIAIDPKEVFGIPESLNLKLEIFRNIAVCGVLATLIPGAYKMIGPLSAMRLPATNLPNSVMVVPVLMGSCIMLVFTLCHLISDIAEVFGRKSSSATKEVQ